MVGAGQEVAGCRSRLRRVSNGRLKLYGYHWFSVYQQDRLPPFSNRLRTNVDQLRNIPSTVHLRASFVPWSKPDHQGDPYLLTDLAQREPMLWCPARGLRDTFAPRQVVLSVSASAAPPLVTRSPVASGCPAATGLVSPSSDPVSSPSRPSWPTRCARRRSSVRPSGSRLGVSTAPDIH